MPEVTSERARFVRTVLVVDDRAFSAAPPAGASGNDDDFESPAAHPVDTKAISDTLANQGISCTVLAPGHTDDADRKRLVSVAQSADVLVLDWTIGVAATAEQENDALPLLTSILASDRERGGRLRLVVIYTGHDGPHHIVRDIRDEMKTLGLSIDESASDHLYKIVAQDVQIHVVGKPDSRAEIPRMSGAELAAKLPGMFDEAFADGLLRRVALEGLVALREHAHELLTTFPAELDQAFLSHRGMTNPGAGEQYARQLIADEVANLLADARIEKWVSQAEVDAALGRMLPGDEPRFLSTANCANVHAQPISVEAAKDVLSRTRQNSEKAAGRGWSSVGTLTSLFDARGAEYAVASARKADEAFTILSLFTRTHEGRRASTLGSDPHLGLGAILVERDGSFWLCMQPLCDSVRLASGQPTPFPLLPMKEITSDGAFDIIVPVDNRHARLRVCVRMRELSLPRFTAGADGAVSVPVREGERVLASEDDRQFRWLGQLRLDHAHRVASLLGASAARIGLDEPEWSRRRADRS